MEIHKFIKASNAVVLLLIGALGFFMDEIPFLSEIISTKVEKTAAACFFSLPALLIIEFYAISKIDIETHVSLGGNPAVRPFLSRIAVILVCAAFIFWRFEIEDRLDNGFYFVISAVVLMSIFETARILRRSR